MQARFDRNGRTVLPNPDVWTRAVASPAIRLFIPAGILTLELVTLSIAFDTAELNHGSGLVGFIEHWGPSLLRSVIAFIALYATFGFFTANGRLTPIYLRLAGHAISWGKVGGHICLMIAFATVSLVLFRGTSVAAYADLVAVIWVITGILAALVGACALVPLNIGAEVFSVTRVAALPAATGACIALFTSGVVNFAWEIFASATFEVVSVLLRLFYADLIVNPAALTIGTSRFQVTILRECSGLEGVGLMLVFGTLWLWFFRREYRFPHALLLLPIGCVAIWCLNSVRIAGLILIGTAGAERVALGGFHSQAGWIMFNMAALTFAVVLHGVPWLRTEPCRPARSADVTETATAWYLIPFLAILAAAMVSRAASDGFETFYPLRFVAAAVALWCFRRKYTTLDWRMGWAAPICGITVFAVWLLVDWINGPEEVSGPAFGATSLSHPELVAWIVFRAVATIVTVPIAEELAFRGYLLRRLVAVDFQRVIPRSFTIVAIATSSIVFGILHGNRWIEGTIAGVLYAIAYRHCGRFGDAVAAHAITNALLAVWVLITGNWQLW